jgi:hypothetical protein
METAKTENTKLSLLQNSSVLKWALLAVIFTIIGLMNFSIAILSNLAVRVRLPWKYPLIWEFTDAYGMLALLPIMLWFMARHPLDRGTLKIRVPLHILASVIFGYIHSLLMWGSGKIFDDLMDWRQYDWSFTGYHFLMEGIKQVSYYWSIYFVFAAIRYAKKSRESELAATKLEHQLVEAKLSALKMQLNPHFLFNTLNMISSDIEHFPRRADATLHHLSDFLRNTLHNAPAQEVSLEREIELLSAYIEIMKARFEDRLRIDVDVAEETCNVLVPHLILQPLVENSITQCMADFSRKGHVHISSVLSNNRLRLIIEDNGPGLLSSNNAVPAHGIGLSNTAERLKHLYGEKQRLELSNRPEGGLRLLIEIPRRLQPNKG